MINELHATVECSKCVGNCCSFIPDRRRFEFTFVSYTARQLRIMFLLQQWDKPINFSDQTIAEAKDKVMMVASLRLFDDFVLAGNSF